MLNVKQTGGEKDVKFTISFTIVILFFSASIPNAAALLPTEHSIIRSGIIATTGVGSGPDAVAYDSANGNIYVANYLSSDVSVVNGTRNQLIDTIHVGPYPDGIAYDPINGYVYVVVEGSSDYLTNTTVIDGKTNKIVASIPMGSFPAGAAYDSSNGYVYVAIWDGGAVNWINTTLNKDVGGAYVEAYPLAIAYDSANNEIYVTNEGSNTVSVINGTTNQVVKTIPVGNAPYGIAYDSTNGYLYVANQGFYPSSNVTVIDGHTNEVIGTIGVEDTPTGVAYDSSSNYIFVTNRYSNDVSVIDGKTNQVIASINVQTEPVAAAYDSGNGYIYVANFDTGTLSVISFQGSTHLYSVMFAENGLPEGKVWSVTLNGESYPSSLYTIKFSEPDGTYSFSVASSGYGANPASGTITVNGGDMSDVITFTIPRETLTTCDQSPCISSHTVTSHSASSTETGGKTKSEVCHNGSCSDIFAFLIGGSGTVALAGIVIGTGSALILVLNRRRRKVISAMKPKP